MSWKAHIAWWVFLGVAAFSMVGILKLIGIFWFEPEQAFWSFALGFGVGVALVPPSLFAVAGFYKRLSSEVMGITYVSNELLEQVALMSRNYWDSQYPIADMNRWMFTINWRDSKMIASNKRIVSIVMLAPVVTILFGGVICLLVAWHTRNITSLTFVSTLLFSFGSFQTFHGLVSLVPIQTKKDISPSTQAFRAWLGGPEFELELDRVPAFQLETMHGWRPGTSHPASAQLFARLMQAGASSPLAASATLSGLRGAYLSALGAHNWRNAEVLASSIEQLIRSRLLSKHVASSGILLLAFHEAFIRNVPTNADMWLQTMDHDRALQNTPLASLTRGLIWLGAGNVDKATTALSAAHHNWTRFRAESGVAVMWLEFCDRVLETVTVKSTPLSESDLLGSPMSGPG